ncbi:YggN family protein [Vibrio sp. SM6]|uniref:YggN family protein n=1 Tax=Vibrio agarilyticus TaxID=2726741 RepID=A0A7X8YH19_9VIBR|nr:DUF2884 family protein [Vibrio agarilyticus]NLS13135.1 YggN family protein [Vibrio agarilyticus]
MMTSRWRLLLVSVFTYCVLNTAAIAAPCRVAIENEIRLNNRQITIENQQGDIAALTATNQLKLNGVKQTLSPEQQSALERYRSNVLTYLPKAHALTEKTLILAHQVLDEAALSVASPGVFDGAKTSLTDFVTQWQSQLNVDGDWTIPVTQMGQFSQRWQGDLEQAKTLLSQAMTTSAFELMTQEMAQNGRINLTELSQKISELSLAVKKRMQEHKGELDQQWLNWCQSLAQTELHQRELQQLVPQLQPFSAIKVER